MQTKLERIAELAKERPEERFTSLVHLINEELNLPRFTGHQDKTIIKQLEVQII